jgi:plastocyanin
LPLQCRDASARVTPEACSLHFEPNSSLARRDLEVFDLRPGQTVDHPFAGAGVYHIDCAIHPTLKLTVEAGSATDKQTAAK